MVFPMDDGAVRKVGTIGRGLLVGLGLTVLCAAAARWTTAANPAHPNIVSLEFAGSSTKAVSLLQGSRPAIDDRTIEALRSGITRDWFLIAAYVATLFWWCVYGFLHFRMGYVRKLSLVLAFASVGAGLADVAENLWLRRLLTSRGTDDMAARWATAATIPKWVLLVCAVPVALAGFLTGLGRIFRRLLRRHGHRLPPPLALRILPVFDGPTPRTDWTRPKDMDRHLWNATADRPSRAGRKEGEPVVGMCFSGGGIRSATFNMGVLQTLTKTPAPPELGGGPSSVLRRTDFLTCVSGGAYIGGALQILAHTTEAGAEPPTFEQGSPEENHVRLHGRYIADNLSEWLEAMARVLSGTLANLLVFTLVLFVLARPVGWVQRHLLFGVVQGGQLVLETSPAMWYAVAWPAGLGVLVLLGGTVAGSFEGPIRGRLQTLAFGLLSLAGAVLLVVWLVPTLARLVPHWVENLGSWLPLSGKDEKKAGATALFVSAGGSMAGSALAIITRPTPPPETAKTVKRPSLASLKKWVALGLPHGAGLFLGFLAFIVFALFTSEAANAPWRAERTIGGLSLEALVWLTAVAVLGALYLWADQTRWSLGPFYRRRLASAFAIQRCDGRTGARELPWEVPTTLSEFAKPHPHLPEVLVCAAANLSEQEAAPPGRRAVSFVFGAEAVGGPEIGWARTKDFEAACSGPIDRDSTFLGAIAISGAAFASAMGHQSKGSINYLLAATNTRLGVWLPSPRYVAELRGQVAEPQYEAPDPGPYGGPWVRRRRFSYLFKELFGLYSLEDRFVYLSDGGHYENLGLIELLRRRCEVILCFDASGDDLITCGTFVEALSLAQEELGVEVDIDLAPLAPRKRPAAASGLQTALDGRLSEHSVVHGKITYLDGSHGHLVLAKASLTAETPAIVLAHAARQKKATFPNDSTADQFFDESQFNAYLGLGRHVAAEAAVMLGWNL